MITYNHARYLQDAVESVLSQRTRFPVECWIGDDCSTDGAAEIAAEYGRRYPERVRVAERRHNIGATPNFVDLIGRCRGKYIALLEGDDYWTDPDKLQKQVELLEAHPSAALAFHRVAIRTEGADGEFRYEPEGEWRRDRDLRDLLQENYIPTCSVLLRNGLVTAFPRWYFQLRLGDWPFFILLLEHGPALFLDEVMATYRVHAAGAWSTRPDSFRQRRLLEMFHHLQRHFNGRHADLLRRSIDRYHSALAGNLRGEAYGALAAGDYRTAWSHYRALVAHQPAVLRDAALRKDLASVLKRLALGAGVPRSTER